MKGVVPLLEDIVNDFEQLRYLADDYKDSFTRVSNGMQEAASHFETLKRR